MKIFHQEIETKLFEEGVYSSENQITDDMVKFIFIHFLHFADPKATLGGSDTLHEFSHIMLKITDNSFKVASCGKALFRPKYPSQSFLKLFGQYLTFVPPGSKADDESVSILVEAILKIVSRFNIDHNSNTALKLIAYATQFAVPSAMPVVASYLKNSAKLYRYSCKALPYVSMHSLDLLPQLDTTRSARMVIGETFLNSLTSLFISASETLKNYPKYQTNIIESFETIWGTTALMSIRFQLLCSSFDLKIPIMTKLEYIFSDIALCQITQDSTSIPFLSSCIMLLGVLIRFNPTISTDVINSQLFVKILKSVPKIDYKHLDEYDYIITSVLQMINNFLIYSPTIMTHRENINSLFEFLDLIHKQIDKQKRNSTTWIDTNLNIIVSLYDQIIEMIPFIFPNKDYFSHVYNSCLTINEEYLINKYQIQKPLITYFMIDRKSVASFIESSDFTGPKILLIRRLSGKVIYKINSDYIGAQNYIEISNEIKQVQLPKLDKTIPTIPEDQLFCIDLIEELPVHIYDEPILKKYEHEYNNWLNWDKYGMYESTKPIKPHRPFVFDFITTLNIYSNVQILEENNKLYEALNELDQIDQLNIIPIMITTIFSTDTSLTQETKRMTPKLKTFLNKFGEPLNINDNKIINLPLLSTTIPSIPSLNGFIVILNSSMIKNENDIKEFNKIDEKAPIKIIFNESNFDLKKINKKKTKQLILVIKPMDNELYHVMVMSHPRWLFSPFATEQVMSIEALQFNIAICCEQNLRNETNNKMSNESSRRKEIMSELVTGENRERAFFDAIAKEGI